MAPELGSIRRKTRRPNVLFPDPDSPTRPRVLPAWMSSEMSSTARTSPLARAPSMDSPRGKTFVRLRISTRAGGMNFVYNQSSGAEAPCCFHRNAALKGRSCTLSPAIWESPRPAKLGSFRMPARSNPEERIMHVPASACSQSTGAGRIARCLRWRSTGLPVGCRCAPGR